MQPQKWGITRLERVRITVLAAFGSYVEWYDYFIAAFAATLIWPTVFFAKFKVLSYAISITSFGVSYFTRPIGAYIFGHLGDREGRRTSLIWTLLTVGLAMLGITILPGSDKIGVWGPILLFTFRAIQGLGFGGEFGGAISWVLEANANSKWRGTLTTLMEAVVGLGGGTGALFYLFLEHSYSKSDLLGYGWRIPFAVGFVLLFSTALIRYFAQESRIFIKLKEEGKVLKRPANTAVKKHFGLILLAGLLWLYVFWVNPGVIQLFATRFLTQYGVTPAYVTFTLVITNFTFPLANILGGFLSDLIGRRTVIAISAFLTIIFAYPYLIMVESGNPLSILLAQVFFACFALFGVGGLTPYTAELFNPQYRYSGGGLSYQFSALYAGILFTFVIPIILQNTQPTLYILGISIALPLLSVLGIVFLKETFRSDVSQ